MLAKIMNGLIKNRGKVTLAQKKWLADNKTRIPSSYRDDLVTAQKELKKANGDKEQFDIVSSAIKDYAKSNNSHFSKVMKDNKK